MRIKRIVLLVVFSFLISGCSAEYTLIYENNVLKESLNVTALKDVNIDGISFINLVDNYYNKIDLMVDYTIEPGEMNEEEVKKKYDFYNKELINKNDLYGINLNYDYENKEKLSNSAVSFSLFENIEVTDNSIEASSPKNIFKNYPDLEDITISFKTDKKVIRTNSNEENDGVYYWYIDKDNYEYASINIQIDNTVNQLEYEKRADNITKYSILGTIVFVVGLGLFVFVKVVNSNKK